MAERKEKIMINESLYQQHISKITDHAASSVRIVRDINAVKEFEQQSGKLTGVFDNLPYFTMNMDVYSNADGTFFRYCNIEYPKMGAAVLPVFQTEGQEDRVLLLMHYRNFVNKIMYEIPRGFANLSDISTKITAIREFEEETGITPENSDMKIMELGTLCVDSGLSNAEISLYAAKISVFDQQYLANYDQQEAICGYRLFWISEIEELIIQNQITDSFTLAAVFRYQLMK